MGRRCKGKCIVNNKNLKNNDKIRENGIQKQPPEVLFKKGVLRNFTKFTGEHQRQSLAQVFSSEFCEISKNTIFYRTPLVAASGYQQIFIYLHLNIFAYSPNTYQKLKNANAISTVGDINQKVK